MFYKNCTSELKLVMVILCTHVLQKLYYEWNKIHKQRVGGSLQIFHYNMQTSVTESTENMQLH